MFHTCVPWLWQSLGFDNRKVPINRVIITASMQLHYGVNTHDIVDYQGLDMHCIWHPVLQPAATKLPCLSLFSL
mgnify:FL=1